MRWLWGALFFAATAWAGAAQVADVTPGRAIDWPKDSGAHPAYRIEWWYVTGWLETPDHQPLGFQVTFFRSGTTHEAKGGEDVSAFDPSQLIIAHVALADPAYGRLVHDQNIARQGFGLAYAKVGQTDLRLDTWHMTRAPDGTYTVVADATGLALHITLTPTQPLMLQGEQGYSRKGPLAGQASYYYSEPQLKVHGSVRRPSATGAASESVAVTGHAWLDHEWSNSLMTAGTAGWDWFGANLDDGAALTAFRVRDSGGHVIWAHATLRDRDGHTTQFGPAEVEFIPERQWRSPRTDSVYPVAFQVRMGAMRWHVSPLIDDQELDARESTFMVYWEGAVTLTGDGASAGRRGRGYLELTGYTRNATLQAW
ncbi:lipocalin-like domain-containing protein [Dyella silvae]|uniref:lipocalin-like domain-containing protein n=1 Tax=Dyella silvae TaxID=2994424 RepID=UPI002265470D|nr:lipocalin-like domain-containing protein [Dyella silvae]